MGSKKYLQFMKTINNVTEFEKVITGDKPLLLKFYADWCGDCKAIQPVLEDLSNTYQGKIDFVKVDVEAQHELASLYNVKGIPALFFIKDQKTVDQVKGVQPKAELEKRLNQLLV
ncbi:MAG: thioredoxin [Dyadobacter sp.]